MVLSAEQIKSIAKGTVHWQAGLGNGLIPWRYSPQQIGIYSASERRIRNGSASAGIRLEFSTDATAFRMVFRVFRGETRDWYGLDLYVDGNLQGHFAGLLTEPDHNVWEVLLPAGEKTVTVHLPCTAGVEILEVQLQNATVCAPLGERKEKILFLGDSITQGLDSRFPSFTYATMLANHRNADFLNQGNGGEIFNSKIIVPLDWQPTMAVIAYGTNDWSAHKRDQVTDNAAEFLRRFCEVWPDLPTVVLTPLWRADAETRREDDFYHEEVAQILQREGEKYPQIHVICGYDLLPAIPELMQDNRLHPNDLGFVVFGKRLTQILDKLFPQEVRGVKL